MAVPSLHNSQSTIDSSVLEDLVGYNARRAALVIIELFLQRMAVYELRPVEFSVASLIAHNPGITSRQLCSALGILPPNLVSTVNISEKRGLITRQPLLSDGRATSLHSTPAGEALMRNAEKTAHELEEEATARLTTAERKTLIWLLEKSLSVAVCVKVSELYFDGDAGARDGT